MTDRAEKLRALAEKARGLPKVPGVYLMKDAAGVVLRAIQLDHQLRPGTEEIDDIGANRDLPPELRTEQSAISEHAP